MSKFKGLTNDELQNIMNASVRKVTSDTAYEKKYARYAVIVIKPSIVDYVECIGSNFYDLSKAVGEAYLYLCGEIDRLCMQTDHWTKYQIGCMLSLDDDRGYVIRLYNIAEDIVCECYILADWYENQSIHDYD